MQACLMMPFGKHPHHLRIEELKRRNSRMFPYSIRIRIIALSLSLSLIPVLGMPPAAAANGKQDLQVVEATVADFLRTQSIGLPGEVDITLTGIDARTSVPP